MSDNLLEIRDLAVEYTSAGQIIHAVNGVSFSIEKGKTMGLVGETGAGKTTIARSILRILPDPPARIVGGEIVYDGQELLKASEQELLSIRGNKISMIFQDPMTALNPLKTVGDQIREVISIHNNNDKTEASKKRAVEMLEMVGIPGERYEEYPFQFSGGMKQRIVIAMALACDPELLLADEPTTALDVTIQAQVLEMMNSLKSRLSTSVLLITHDLGVVAEMCDSVAVLYAGEIIEMGDKFDIFDHPSHPYTVGLFQSLPSMVSEEEKRLHPIPGMMPNPTELPKGCKFAPRCPYASEECEEPVELAEISKGHVCRCRKAGIREVAQ